MDSNRVLMDVTLKSHFTLILFVENSLGEVKEYSFKKKKKEFFKALGNDDKYVAKLVDSFPSELKLNTIYLKRDGKTAWLREMEGE